MDLQALPGVVVPYVIAAIGSYGARLLDKVGDATVDRASAVGVDAAAGLGWRLIRRIAAREEFRPAVEQAVDDLASSPVAAENAIRSAQRCSAPPPLILGGWPRSAPLGEVRPDPAIDEQEPQQRSQCRDHALGVRSAALTDLIDNKSVT